MRGRTDAILLSYYLGKVYGWDYSKRAPKEYSAIEAEPNQEIKWYKKDADNLVIFGVGGKDNFKNVVIVADKDLNDVPAIETLHTELLSPYAGRVVNSEWSENEFTDKFGNVHSVRTLSIIIPEDKQGALHKNGQAGFKGTFCLCQSLKKLFNLLIIGLAVAVLDNRVFAEFLTERRLIFSP